MSANTDDLMEGMPTASPDDIEGAQKARNRAAERQREQLAGVSAGERKKRKLLQAKREREQEAGPVDITLTDDDLEGDGLEELELTPELKGMEFEFDRLPMAFRNHFEDVTLQFLGSDEDDLTGEDARVAKEAKERMLDVLVEYSEDGLDEEFWTEMTDFTDRQLVLGSVIAEQGK